MDSLQVQMLGEFSLTAGEQQISDRENRSRKVWLLLAYLIYYRQRTVSQDELIDLLWGKTPRGNNPLGALKTTFHRVRTALDQLWPSAGHQLIIRRDNGYAWNNEIPLILDVDVFDQLCQTPAADEEGQIQILLSAAKLYGGDFLMRLSSDPWTIPISAHYHNLYVQVLLKLLPLLIQTGRQSDAVELCWTASTIEPFHEDIHRFLMRGLLDLGEQGRAITVYKELSERLFSNFGIMPSGEIRKLYREAARIVNERALPIEEVLEQLQEPDAPSGALVCEYDFFIVLCQSVARSMARNGIATHIALLSVCGKNGNELSKRSLSLTMENLEDQIRTNLRKGDAVSRCSVSQYVLMLPQANYENGCMICNRIIKAFLRQYPHSPAEIQYAVYPLAPKL